MTSTSTDHRGAVSDVASLGVAAVVVNFNGGDHLADCVKSLLSERVGEVVVVDNGSSDGSLKMLREFELGVKVIESGWNRGYGGGANLGVAACGGEFLLVCNSDLVVQPGSIGSLVEAIGNDPLVGIVGPRLVELDGSLYPSARCFPSLGDAIGHGLVGLVTNDNRFSKRYKMLGWDHASSRQVDWVSGACFLARRKAYTALGGFDESYFMYMEDVDLCWRAWNAGWRVAYEPSATVVHAQGVSTARSPYAMTLAHHRSLLRFVSRTSRGTSRILLPAVAAGIVGRACIICVRDAVGRGRERLGFGGRNY